MPVPGRRRHGGRGCHAGCVTSIIIMDHYTSRVGCGAPDEGAPLGAGSVRERLLRSLRERLTAVTATRRFLTNSRRAAPRATGHGERPIIKSTSESQKKRCQIFNEGSRYFLFSASSPIRESEHGEGPTATCHPRAPPILGPPRAGRVAGAPRAARGPSRSLHSRGVTLQCTWPW